MEDLIKQWIEKFNHQNEMLVTSGEEPLTADEFIACRIEDAVSFRDEKREKHEREWWKTYRAALSGLLANQHTLHAAYEELHKWSGQHANAAHGPLEK